METIPKPALVCLPVPMEAIAEGTGSLTISDPESFAVEFHYLSPGATIHVDGPLDAQCSAPTTVIDPELGTVKGKLVQFLPNGDRLVRGRQGVLGSLTRPDGSTANNVVVMVPTPEAQSPEAQ